MYYKLCRIQHPRLVEPLTNSSLSCSGFLTRAVSSAVLHIGRSSYAQMMTCVVFVDTLLFIRYMAADRCENTVD